MPLANAELKSISKDALYNYTASLKVSFTYYKLFCTARQNLERVAHSTLPSLRKIKHKYAPIEKRKFIFTEDGTYFMYGENLRLIKESCGIFYE